MELYSKKISVGISKIAFFIVITFSSYCVHGDVEKWVDDQGNVHYGDNLAAKKQGEETETVEIWNAYSIPDIETKDAIKYVGDKPSRSVIVDQFSVKLRNSNYRDVRVGKITCGRQVDLYWMKGEIEVTESGIDEVLSQVFAKNGYRFTKKGKGSLSGVSMHLNLSLKGLKINACPGKSRKHTKDNVYVRLDWALVEPSTNSVVYEGTTEGSYDAMEEPYEEDGTSKRIDLAIQAATNNLLSDHSFVSKLEAKDFSNLTKKYDKYFKLNLDYGSRLGGFSNSVDDLKDSSLIVAVEEGHGSGILLNNDGYVLTNAHVVGDQSNVKVEFEKSNIKQSRSASVVRINKIRDVALLKIENTSFLPSGVSISKVEPKSGEGIYVIGAPLDKNLSHSVTKGIISAKRNIDGLPYLQTDAAINPGNSGGPVFNEQGALVAVTVAGIFTQQGASLNINYLIPVEDALKGLNIVNQGSVSAMIDSVLKDGDGNEDELDQEKTFKDYLIETISKIDHWLSQPVL